MNSFDKRYAECADDVEFALEDWEGLMELSMDLDFRKLDDPKEELENTEDYLGREQISYTVYGSPEPGFYHLKLVRENARLREDA